MYVCGPRQPRGARYFLPSCCRLCRKASLLHLSLPYLICVFVEWRAHLIKFDDCFELRLHRFLVSSGMGNHFNIQDYICAPPFNFWVCIMTRTSRALGGVFFFAIASPRFSFQDLHLKRSRWWNRKSTCFLSWCQSWRLFQGWLTFIYFSMASPCFFAPMHAIVVVKVDALSSLQS